MADRRGFLRGLVTLPLIGGGVTLIGRPTAAAVPVTGAMLSAYERWLDLERSFLRYEMYGANHRNGPFGFPFECVFRDRSTGRVWDIQAATGLDFDHGQPAPSTRAAVILSAAGAPLTEGSAP